MRPQQSSVLCLAALVGVWSGLANAPAVAADDGPETAAIQTAATALVKDFNAGKAEAVVAQFLPQGELIDEDGTIYKGRDELQKLFTQYFTRFPGATLGLEIESVRAVSDGLAIEEGTRYLSTKDGAKAQVRYVTVRVKTDGQWRIASTREFNDDPAPSPGEHLAPLAWFVGDWISEGQDAAVKVSYRWSEDKNFLLGEFHSTRNGTSLMKSTQRIGWDPLAGKIRSWLFDADGGFAEGIWTLVEDGWLIKSQATLPEGTSGSATVTITPKNKDQFTMRGTDRIVGDSREEDFELIITRAPPDAKAKAAPANSSPPGAKPAPAGTKTVPAAPTKSPAVRKR